MVEEGRPSRGRVGVSDLLDLNASGRGSGGRPLALIWVAAGIVTLGWVMWL